MRNQSDKFQNYWRRFGRFQLAGSFALRAAETELN
jgi:hypothetical protein